MDERFCVWRKGSTSRDTGMSEPTDFCKARMCAGVFDRCKPLPDCFHAEVDATKSDLVRMAVQQAANCRK